MKLLLIEDHKDIAGVIFDYFELKGHILDYAGNGQQGLELGSNNYYDVIILDVMLPMMDGLEVCQAYREQGIDTPVLMLTARDHNDDILSGFDCGADDYLVKPFDLKILEARVTALYKRNQGQVASKQLSFEDLNVDIQSGVASRRDKKFTLNQTQRIILKLLINKSPQLVTRDELIHAIWQGEEPDGDILRSHIYQLRNLIDRPFEQKYIHTIPKKGYLLAVDSSGSQ